MLSLKSILFSHVFLGVLCVEDFGLLRFQRIDKNKNNSGDPHNRKRHDAALGAYHPAGEPRRAV